MFNLSEPWFPNLQKADSTMLISWENCAENAFQCAQGAGAGECLEMWLFVTHSLWQAGFSRLFRGWQNSSDLSVILLYPGIFFFQFLIFFETSILSFTFN